MKLFIIFVAIAIASAYGKPQYDGYPINGAASDNKYMVKPVGPHFGQSESRIGNRVFGTYFVLLTDDPRIQVVDYIADENSYRQKVSYLLPINSNPFSKHY